MRRVVDFEEEYVMRLKGKKIGVLIEDGFEDLEFWVTVMRLREEGAQVRILGSDRSRLFTGKNGLKASSTDSYAEVPASQLDALIVPGGWAPDKLRRSGKVLELVAALHAQGKILGLICHAGLVGISAKIVKGQRCTGSLGIRDDLLNAGASFVDVPALRDGNLVWGRVVEDIPDFCRELVAALESR
jgi:protease I